jgi:iron complex transport system substrate-binding protein
MRNEPVRIKRAAASVCALLILTLLGACSGAKLPASGLDHTGLGNGWQKEARMALQYARNFSVDYYAGGYKLISISNGSRFLLVPEDAGVPAGIDGDIVILRQPIDDIYLVATSAMCLFDALGALDSISMSGTEADGWYVQNAREAMEKGDIVYAGKYSKPDYELITAKGCKLAIESTMINHTPEVREKLEELGVPVLIEQSSYEKHPLGRTEWIKLYAALVGKEDAARRIFDEQAAYVDAVSGLENTGKTVAYFYISSSGLAVARKSGDYVTKMIELAGGNYIFRDLGDPDTATSTVTLEMERFYAGAKEADYIIYDGSIVVGVSSLKELIGKNKLLADFKAVKEGHVWCAGKNLFQETTQLGLMISDIHKMLVSGNDLTELNFMYKLQ